MEVLLEILEAILRLILPALNSLLATSSTKSSAAFLQGSSSSSVK